MIDDESALDRQIAADMAATEAARQNPSESVDIEQDSTETEEVQQQEEQVEELDQEIEETKQELAEANPDEKVELKKRLDSQFRQKRKLAEQLARANSELEVLRGQRTETRDEQIDREVNSRLDTRAQEIAFQGKTSAINQKGTAEFRDYDSTISKLNEEALGGNGLAPLTKIISDMAPGDEHRILHFLGKNPTIAEGIVDDFNESMALGFKSLNKIIEKAAKPAPVASKAAVPIKRVSTNTAQSAAGDLSKMSMDDYMKTRDKEDHERRMSRGY